MNITNPDTAAENLLRRFASALRGAQLYSDTHPLVGRNLAFLVDTFGEMLAAAPSVTIAMVGDEIIVDSTPVPKAVATMGDLMRRLRSRGIERITVSRGVAAEDVAALVAALNGALSSTAAVAPEADDPAFAIPHVRVGRVRVEAHDEANVHDMATIQRLYNDAVAAAGRIWQTVEAGDRPDLREVRAVVNSLAFAVAQNRTALMALTALKNTDNYSFTHMVNVSILTMAQARSVGVSPAQLREFGLAALLHDIGKVHIPAGILHKPDKLTEEEFAIVKRHPVDGAELLRLTPDVPPIVPIVAFEHHLRLDGSGYPEGVARPALNLATMLCSIADVYDAMRTERRYQHAFPMDRVLEVLERNDGREFERHLVRRFVQVVGVYPAGSLVRLNTGAIAVVTMPHPGEPHRPSVRVIREAGSNGRSVPYDANLWESDLERGLPSSISSPVDPVDAGIDPLEYL